MAAPPAGAQALPPGTLRVRLAGDVRVRDGGRALVGGRPFRLTRLTAAGAALAATWAAGAPIGAGPARAALARRLLDAGLLVADPDAVRPGDDVVVVVPTRDRSVLLDRCLAAVAATAPGVAIVVVDDGSRDAAAVAAVALRHGARVVACGGLGAGPAAARNAGLAATTQPFVAFVDSDVVVVDGWLGRLRGAFADPLVGAAAPRVHPLAAPTRGLAGYEARHSSLDLGPRPGRVGPGRPVPFVPTTTLVVRRAAVPGGFDPVLHVGEDVDFVWRMGAAGWHVAYDPAARVRHDHRVAPAALVARRWAYARSIGPLARRHGAALTPLHAEPVTVAALALAAARRPRAAAAVVVLRALLLRRRLAGRAPRPSVLAAELTVLGLRATTEGTARAVRRVWAPALLLAWAAGARRAGVLLAAAHIVRLLEEDHPRLGDLPLAVVDDALAAVGTWESSLRSGTLAPLLPVVRARSNPW